MFEPNAVVPFTSFRLPTDGTYEVLPGCADVAIKPPWAALHVVKPVCPSRSACTCLASIREWR